MSIYIDIWLFHFNAKKNSHSYIMVHYTDVLQFFKNRLSLNGYLGSLPTFWYYKKVEAKNVAVDLLSRVQPVCYPMNCSLLGSSVHSISQARILERVAISFSRGSSWTKAWTCVSCIAGGFLTAEPPGKPPRIPCVYDHFAPM